MNKLSIFLIFISMVFSAFKNDNPAYLLYNLKGDDVKYAKLIDEAKEADVVLFGESHDNPISHWLELKLTKELFAAKKENFVLAAEMFETDNQLILSEYIDSLITTSRFEEEAKLWPNYKTDYKPIVEFARKNKIPFVAANVPRRYASLVNSKGFEVLNNLPDKVKELLPPLPIAYDPELKCYKSLMNMPGMGTHVTQNFPKAQAIKDATMAHNILKNWLPGKTVLHFNGSYHSDNFESIYWYLKKQNPNLKIVTITTITQDDITKLKKENTGIADFTICVDEEMTKTR